MGCAIFSEGMTAVVLMNCSSCFETRGVSMLRVVLKENKTASAQVDVLHCVVVPPVFSITGTAHDFVKLTFVWSSSPCVLSHTLIKLPEHAVTHASLHHP